MQAVEFVSKAHDGVVDLPRELQNWNGKQVRVILLDEEVSAIEAKQVAEKNVWERTAGAWQGDALVREQSCDTESFLAAISGKLSSDFPDDITDDDPGTEHHKLDRGSV